MSSKNIFQFLIIFHSKFRGQVLVTFEVGVDFVLPLVDVKSK